MTVVTFANDTLTLRRLGVEFSAEMSELAAKDLRDQLLKKYPVEPEEPTAAGWYVTATSDQVLYNDGHVCENWSRPKGAKWSTGNIYEDWVVVARDLGPERLPLKPILKKED